MSYCAGSGTTRPVFKVELPRRHRHQVVGQFDKAADLNPFSHVTKSSKNACPLEICPDDFLHAAFVVTTGRIVR